MPNYVQKKLVEYDHKKPERAQYCPYAPPPVRYGKDSNLTIPEEKLPDEKKYIQIVMVSVPFHRGWREMEPEVNAMQIHKWFHHVNSHNSRVWVMCDSTHKNA